MKKMLVLPIMAVCLAIGCVGLFIGGCRGIPTGTAKVVAVGNANLQATGAGIVKVEAGKTTYKIKCSLCGYETETVTIDTPAAGKPYTTTWICPRCGHKQKVAIEIAAK